MSLSALEKATLNFYEWDYLGRGYYSYNEQVDLEPNYVPFRHTTISHEKYIDDGRVPSLLDDFIGLFSKKEVKEEVVEDTPVFKANRSSYTELNAGFSLSFRKGEEISSLISGEFLNMLSFSEAPISFEIIGTYDSITIQIACSQSDKLRIESHLKAYFPLVIIKDIVVEELPFNTNHVIGICDFGISDELARPITIPTSFAIDPLTSIIATMDHLGFDDIIVMQVIFKGVTAPWARDIPYAVSDGMGGSFFPDSPEMVKCATTKISAPLFSTVIRIATQGKPQEKSAYLATQITKSITTISTSEFNKLIPLSNKGYDYQDHLYNLYHRTSNRLGMILNSNELVSFIHYPNKTVHSQKLGLPGGKTKSLPKELFNQKYTLGINEHNGVESAVTLDDEARLRHTHIIGATGVGKSTLIANMMFEDISAGNGCALFDPHGDIVEDIIKRIPIERQGDVVLIDPSDTEFPIGFNLLQAHTEAEKIVLSSDLVTAFKRHATAWGDNMTAVLSNAINTFLESKKGGTLIELKRFLLEDRFREEFLMSVEDQSILYYWHHEYPMMKKGITPLLTRIDTFLRPKIIRYMLAQKDGVDFKACIEGKKIILIKLSQGLIGEENSYLLGSLFLAKINQVAQGRQLLAKNKRHPFYLYLDEFHNFITPSITSILSGARKYGLGLILAHQELAQIEETKVLNSVISNPHTRICFRLGDSDAKKFESGFSYFEHDDLQSLGIGEAIVRIGSSQHDFNMTTYDLASIGEEEAEENTNTIVAHVREHYATPLEEVQKILNAQLPRGKSIKKETEDIEKPIITTDNKEIVPEVELPKIPASPLEQQKEQYLKDTQELEEVRKHRALQNYVKALGQKRGYKTVIEEKTATGGRVDIGLTRDDFRIAVEISVTNTLDYEVKNIQKCIDDGYNHVYMVSESMIHLKNISTRAKATIEKTLLKKVKYLTPLQLPEHLDNFTQEKPQNVKRVRGYRVKSNHIDITSSSAEEKNDTLQKIILSNRTSKKK
ncbi:MAG: hypothetical protein ACI9Y7_000484 [Dokdonia sp.]|jgi:hypothetical protein